MNILHISDLHFGPRHWEGNDDDLLAKLNSYQSDIVINTGDSTTDGLEDEFRAAAYFLDRIECDNLISIIGNHDKRTMRSHQFFRNYINNAEIIRPLNSDRCTKEKIYLNKKITKIDNNYTDVNFIKTLNVRKKKIMIIGVDSNELYNDNGYIEEEVLHAISHQINGLTYDNCLLLTHYSILGIDEDPLNNSLRLIDFINKHKIEHVFCGHTHELEIRRSTDLYHGHTFTHYMCGSLSSCNHPNDTNQFLYYENFGDTESRIHLIRIHEDGGKTRFEEEIIAGA